MHTMFDGDFVAAALTKPEEQERPDIDEFFK